MVCSYINVEIDKKAIQWNNFLSCSKWCVCNGETKNINSYMPRKKGEVTEN